MKIIKTMGALVAIAAIASGCNDVTNPVKQQGQLVGPYVRWESHTGIGTPQGTVLAIIQMPTRVEEDVTIHYTFTGDAAYGTDFYAVDQNGNERADVTAQGGTATIQYDPEQTAFGRDTVRLYVPFDATDGRSVDIEIADAQTASGKDVASGYIDEYQHFLMSIEGFVDVPEGTYSGTHVGDFGSGAAQVTITKANPPIDQGGAQYFFTIDDYTGVGLFGVPIGWAFNVTSGGTVFAPNASYEDATVTSDVTGTFDFDTNTLTLDVTLTCCGASGAQYTLTVTKQ